MLDCFPLKIRFALQKIDFNKLQSIRIRADRPVIVEYDNRNLYLRKDGVFVERSNALSVGFEELKELYFNMCERSIYAYTDKICKGFITLEGGIRVGLGGECVVDDGRIVNVKNISSLNVRIPHRIDGCADELVALYKKGLKNMLVISPPGAGKTTIIRDFAEKISIFLRENVLVVDERGEIFPLISQGDTIDVISYSPKKYAYENGIRALAPSVIVTDEIVGNEDVASLYYANRSGVSIVATMHGDYSNFDLIKSELTPFSEFIDCFIFLSDKINKGEIAMIFDKKLSEIRLC